MKQTLPEGDLNLLRLTAMVAAETGVTQDEAQAIIQATLDVMGRTLAAGYGIRISNFGSFTQGTRRVPVGALSGRVEANRTIKVVRFRATGRLLDAVRDGLSVTSLRKLPKSR